MATIRLAGLKAGDPSEYLVFIEGLINSGRENEAIAFTQEKIELKSATHFALCNGLGAQPKYPDSFGYQGRKIFIDVCEDIDK